MPPWPTSSSTSYRPAIFSPTTLRTLPGRRAPHASQPQPEPQAATPDRIQQADQAGKDPERDERVAARIARAVGGERNDPTDREDAADGQHDTRAADTGCAEAERQDESDDCDQVAGHLRLIGAQSPRAEPRASSQTPSASS